ncbi:MAG: phosphoglycolate phosphatase [Paracoccaceae bacterium]|jgi:phosphoglycolate phosphatase
MKADASRPLRLILFDVDGTLVDSQGSIVTAMTDAFQTMGLAVPARANILSIIGLSLDHAMVRLAPDAPSHDKLVQAYKDAFMARRLQLGSGEGSPLYPGARACLEQLAQVPENLLGVATGKSQRGLDAVLEAHGLEQMFVTRQVADHHPSKPHPSMVQTAMSEVGVDPENTVLIGDTSFDMDMADAAGVAGIGVNWGYHKPEALHRAHVIVDSFAAVPGAINQVWTRSV